MIAGLAVLCAASSTRAEPVSAPVTMLAAIPAIEARTGERVAHRGYRDGPKGNPYCLNEGFCDGFIDELRIEAMGRRIDISPAPRTPPAILVGSCIALVEAFAPGLSAPQAEAVVHQALAQVLDGNETRLELDTVQFDMKRTGENLPACSLVRFVER